MVPRKFRPRFRSGIFDSDVRAAFIFASSEAEEFKTLLSLDASGLFGLFEMDNEGESNPDDSVGDFSMLAV